jgi:hypothetical protein
MTRIERRGARTSERLALQLTRPELADLCSEFAQRLRRERPAESTYCVGETVQNAAPE